MYTAAEIDNKKCMGCKLCIVSCPEPNVLMIVGNKNIKVNKSRCKGCGLCESICTKKAITLRVDGMHNSEEKMANE